MRKGAFILADSDRLFNPSRDTARLLQKAQQIGPQTAAFAHALFVRLGRPGQRALYGLTNLARHYPRAAIEAVCARLFATECFSYAAVKRALERTAAGEVSVWRKRQAAQRYQPRRREPRCSIAWLDNVTIALQEHPH